MGETLAVLDRIKAVRDDEGESPSLSRALTAQMAAVNFLRPKTSDSTAENQIKPAIQLHLSKRPKPESGAESEGSDEQIKRWFAGYHASLYALAEAARSVEVIKA